MGLAHFVFAALAAIILITIIIVVVVVVMHLRLGAGKSCNFNFQCTSRSCDSSWWGLKAGTCQGGDAPWATQPCDDASQCASGACGTGHLVSGSYCCPTGETESCSCCGPPYTWCTNLPTGQPCNTSCPEVCASGNCISGGPGQPTVCQ